MRIITFSLVATAVLLIGCDSVTDAQDDPPIDVSGEWVYQGTVSLVFAGEAAPEFGFEPEGTHLHLHCTASGTSTIQQNGTSFTLVGREEAVECVTLGGQVGPAPWPPGDSHSSGEVVGHAFSFETEPDALSIPCWANATISQAIDGTATAFYTLGGCDLSFLPFDPAAALNNFHYTRP